MPGARNALGKEIGADLREGKLTLPVIKALGSASPGDHQKMTKIILKENFTKAEFEILVDLLNKYQGIIYTRDMAQRYIQKAKAALSVFEPSATRDVLENIADYALTRNV